MIYDALAKKINDFINIPSTVIKNGEIVVSCEKRSFFYPIAKEAFNKLNWNNQKVTIGLMYDHLFMGAIKLDDDNVLIIGPTFRIRPFGDTITFLLKKMNLTKKHYSELEKYLFSIPEFDPMSFLRMMLMFDIMINGENHEINDLVLNNDFLEEKYYKLDVKQKYNQEYAARENSEKIKDEMCFYIKNGMPERIKQSSLNSPHYIGKMAQNEIRQHRNTVVAAATLFSRAAVEGGLDLVTALSISDSYILDSEKITDFLAMETAISDMTLKFANAVADVKIKSKNVSLIRDVRSYINNNIDKKILVNDIAKVLYVNKSYLSTKFKNETGKTLVYYITELKIDEAKRLLKLTNTPLSLISEKLSFSSQSYFQNVFKKVTGMTPIEYREKESTYYTYKKHST